VCTVRNDEGNPAGRARSSSYLTAALTKAIKIPAAGTAFSFSLFLALVSFFRRAARQQHTAQNALPLSFPRNTHSSGARTPGHVPLVFFFSFFSPHSLFSRFFRNRPGGFFFFFFFFFAVFFFCVFLFYSVYCGSTFE